MQLKWEVTGNSNLCSIQFCQGSTLSILYCHGQRKCLENEIKNQNREKSENFVRDRKNRKRKSEKSVKRIAQVNAVLIHELRYIFVEAA